MRLNQGLRWKIVFAAACAFSALAGTASATPTPVNIDLVGRHPVNTTRHEGTFTATAPFCGSGSFSDVSSTPVAFKREFTCGDGSGTITINVYNPPSEHVLGGTNNWTVMQGTGSFTALHGMGTYRVTSAVEPASPGAEFLFTSTWTGLADLDDTAPTARFTRATVKRLGKPTGAYLVRLSFGASDDVAGNAVSWQLAASAGGRGVSRSGEVGPSGAVSLNFNVRGSKSARSLRLTLNVRDVWNNERTVTKTVPLPR